MSKYITLVRHAQSVFNSMHKPIVNCGLTPKGFQQAKKINLLIPAKIDMLFVSPLRRCQETLKSSSLEKHTKNVVTLNLIREHKVHACDFLEGEVQRQESFLDLQKRVQEFKEVLRADTNSNHVVVLGHADYFWHLTAVKQGHETYAIYLENAESVTFFRETLLGTDKRELS